ncbi:MAG: NUDIX domain-containing protein [Phycisphaeraceae bacterium]|nr:NUDIX domain-containing protein [Phycisphaerales bacterium]MCB9859749.1 NUDIX domain-containing protein [Phycisphaeraceae bacterium]
MQHQAHEPLTFGIAHPDVTYIPRPGAYALVLRDDGMLAVVRNFLGLFLPGGGIEQGETDEQALTREIAEECAYHADMLGYIGAATEYVRVGTTDRGQLKQCVFYRARFTAPLHTPVEDGHELVWVSPEEAMKTLYLACHRWVVERM